jgi:multiple antibiotic resistance protein
MPAAGPIVEYALATLTSLFFLIDPIATVPVFLAMTDGDPQAHRCRMARRAALTCVVMLSAFALAGKLIFRLFGITLPAFEIAGGLILLLIGLDMVQARRSRTKEAPGEVEESSAKDDVGIVPLGVPMLAGPGAISTVMVLIARASLWWETGFIFAAITVNALVCYFVLNAADRVGRRMSQTTMHVLTRIMGMLLTAIAIQFIVNGMTALGALGRNK